MSIGNFITTNALLLLGVLFVIIVLVVIGLLSFKPTRTPALIISFVIITLSIVGILAYVFLSPQSQTQNTQFTLTVYNLDTSLEQVFVIFPDSTSYLLTPGQSQTGIIEPSSTVKATGYRIDSSGTKISYDLDYIFNNLTETEIYYTSGGVQTNNSFIPNMNIDNLTASPVILYTQDLKGNIYPYDIVAVGNSTISTYISQIFSTTSTGIGAIVIPNIASTSLLIDTSGALSVADIPSTNLTFKNGVNQAGWLQFQNPWQTVTTWTTYREISAKGESTEVLVYLNQWWRIISQSSSSPITNVYIISQNDIVSQNTITLTN